MQAKELEKQIEKYCEENPVKIYWDYQSSLDVEEVRKITEKDGLWELEEMLFDYNSDYICQLEDDFFCNMVEDLEIPEELKEKARELFEYYRTIDVNIEQVLKNTDVVIRIDINSNYEGFSYMEKPEESEYLNKILPLISHAIDKIELEREIFNVVSQCNVFSAVFSVTADQLVGIKEKLINGKYITIPKEAIFGLFDPCYGSGSVMEINLKKDLKIPLRHNDKYDDIWASVVIDDDDCYGYHSVYGVHVDVKGDIIIE